MKDPKSATGQCHIETERVRSMLALCGVQTKIMYAENRKTAVEVFNNTGQHSNHYAIYLEGSCRVIDFTMRQFDPDSPFPFVGTQREWKDKLRSAWKQETIYAKAFNDNDEILDWSKLIMRNC